MIAGNRLIILAFLGLTAGVAKSQAPDLVLFGGRITTMDVELADAEAIAIHKDKIVALGSTEEMLVLAGRDTKKIDLEGRRMIPGLIDNHVHPMTASRSEFREELPHIESIHELFDWIRKETKRRKKGEWIVHPKFFFTRLKEKRWPSIEELDSLAPRHPVFLNGSYAGMVNTKALEVSGIAKLNEQAVVKDVVTLKPTGLIRQSGLKHFNAGNKVLFSEREKTEALKVLFRHYNEIGITSICAGNGGVEDWNLLKELQKEEELNVRVFQNFTFPFDPKAAPEQIKEALDEFPYKTGDGDEWLRVGALKVFLDGGILTGTAFMGNPWGKKAMKLYGFPDPGYRGELNLDRSQLVNLISASAKAGWKFTAHVTGGAGVDSLLAAYRDADAQSPVSGRRHSVIHGNFFSGEAIRTMKRLGICADVQPIWFHKDVDLLNEVLGEDRMRDFHPYLQMVRAEVVLNGGSDHMVKLDADQAINPYNPFQAMWTVISRQSQGGNTVNEHEAISRENALKMYTVNNAYASFEEKLKGSLTPGKLADLVVLSDDLLFCREELIKAIRPVLTVVGGKIVYDPGILKRQ